MRCQKMKCVSCLMCRRCHRPVGGRPVMPKQTNPTSFRRWCNRVAAFSSRKGKRDKKHMTGDSQCPPRVSTSGSNRTTAPAIIKYAKTKACRPNGQPRPR
ncbi:unnamed protein product [Ectocarpus sp. 12 AP-2014]